MNTRTVIPAKAGIQSNIKNTTLFPSPLYGERVAVGRVMGAGCLLGLRQHIDSVRRAQRRDGVGRVSSPA